jgi:hypothetical protein
MIIYGVARTGTDCFADTLDRGREDGQRDKKMCVKVQSERAPYSYQRGHKRSAVQKLRRTALGLTGTFSRLISPTAASN